MECKDDIQVTAREIDFGINRNIVECKELIDMYKDIKNTRINRNIVECKVSISGDALVVVGRINRNIVECKAGQKCYLTQASWFVLIETLWNVKYLRIHYNFQMFHQY